MLMSNEWMMEAATLVSTSSCYHGSGCASYTDWQPYSSIGKQNNQLRRSIGVVQVRSSTDKSQNDSVISAPSYIYCGSVSLFNFILHGPTDCGLRHQLEC